MSNYHSDSSPMPVLLNVFINFMSEENGEDVAEDSDPGCQCQRTKKLLQKKKKKNRPNSSLQITSPL